jgi:uncharacterized membrane protein YgcG
MSLLDKLREVADFPISHVPSVSEALPLLGALIAHVEHGDTLFQAAEAGAQELNELLAGEPPKPEPAPVSVAPTQPTDKPPAAAPLAAAAGGHVFDEVAHAPGDDLAAENAALRQQVETLLANQRRTTGSVDAVPPAL